MFNLYAECWLDDSKAGIKIARKNINSLIYADDATLMAESKEKLKNLLMKVKEESKKVGIKLSIHKLRSLHPALSLHGKQMGKKVETVADFIFLGSKISADSDCSHEIKRRLLLGRKVMTNLDNL